MGSRTVLGVPKIPRYSSFTALCVLYHMEYSALRNDVVVQHSDTHSVLLRKQAFANLANMPGYCRGKMGS